MEKTAVTCVAWLPRGIYNGRLDGGQEPIFVEIGWRKREARKKHTTWEQKDGKKQKSNVK